MLVPPGSVGVLGGVRSRGDGLEGGDVGLGGGVAVEGGRQMLARGGLWGGVRQVGKKGASRQGK